MLRVIPEDTLLYSSRLLRCGEKKKDWETVTDQRRLGRHDSKCNVVPRMRTWNTTGTLVEKVGNPRKRRVQLIIMYQCWCLRFDKCAMLREALTMGNQGDKYLYNFSVNLNLKVYLKILRICFYLCENVSDIPLMDLLYASDSDLSGGFKELSVFLTKSVYTPNYVAQTPGFELCSWKIKG